MLKNKHSNYQDLMLELPLVKWFSLSVSAVLSFHASDALLEKWRTHVSPSHTDFWLSLSLSFSWSLLSLLELLLPNMDKTLCSPVSAVELSTPQTSRESQRNLSKVNSTSLSNTLHLLINQSAPCTASAQPPLLSKHQTQTLPKLNSKPGVDTLILLAQMLMVTPANHPAPPSLTKTS